MSRWILLLTFVLAYVVGSSAAAAPPAGMPDPRAMSGIPRPDAQVPAGTITVRVLRGSFDNPVLQHPVTLALTSADGSQTDSRTVDTKTQGRATFDGLEAFNGGSATASVELDGETLSSAPMTLRTDVGTAVMLVSGGAPAPSDGTPMPGIAFEFDEATMGRGVAAGELMVGAFDLSTKRPVEHTDIVLRIREPDKAEVTRTLRSDREGKVVFGGLDKYAKGTRFVAEAQITADGPKRHSETFDLIEGKGMAVVLATGQFAEAPAAADPHRPQVAPVKGPRTVPSLAQGSVRIKLVDGVDRAVAGQDVKVILQDASQTQVEFGGKTDATGVAMLTEVEVRSDAFYFVAVVYDGGPYRSGFFQMDREGGIAVDLRVYETTADYAAVQSALQFEVRESENDMAQVYRIYEVVVRGEKAFWVPGGMELHAPEEAKGVTVLRPAEPWLDHEGKAPFAKLSRPIPPGEPIHLSMAWVEEHDGEVVVDWSPPFSLLQSGVIVNKAYKLAATGAKQSEREAPDPEVELWELGTAMPVRFTISELPIRNPTFRTLGAVLGVALGFIGLFAIVSTPRVSAKQRLLNRREELLALLAAEGADGLRRDRIIAALDRAYRQLDALEKLDGSGPRDEGAAA